MAKFDGNVQDNFVRPMMEGTGVEDLQPLTNMKIHLVA